MSVQEFEKPNHYFREIFEVVLKENIHEIININEYPIKFQAKLTKNLPGEKKYKIYFQILNKKINKIVNYGEVIFSDINDPKFNKLINIFEMELERYKNLAEIYLNPENIKLKM